MSTYYSIIEYITMSWHPSSYPLKAVLRSSAALAHTQFTLRTDGSVIGMLWYLLEPILVFIILMLVAHTVGIDHVYYAPYLFLGLIMFNVFASATQHATQALTSNRELITSLRIRFEIFPLANVFQFIFSHAIELFFFLALLIYAHIPLWNVVLYPLIYLPFLLFITGVALILAVTQIYTTDLANVWRILVGRLLWLATPIFYVVHEGSVFAQINLLNPLVYYIESARSLLIYQTVPQFHLMAGCYLWAAVSLLIGAVLFARSRHVIPEHI